MILCWRLAEPPAVKCHDRKKSGDGEIQDDVCARRTGSKIVFTGPTQLNALASCSQPLRGPRDASCLRMARQFLRIETGTVHACAINGAQPRFWQWGRMPINPPPSIAREPALDPLLGRKRHCGLTPDSFRRALPPELGRKRLTAGLRPTASGAHRAGRSLRRSVRVNLAAVRLECSPPDL